MTVSNTTSVVYFNGNGALAPIPIPYRFFKNSDLVVLKRSASGVSSVLALNVDYTVVGAGSLVGGTVTPSTAVLTGEMITVARILTLQQLTDLRNQGDYFAEIHEDVFDYLTMLVQQVAESDSRALRHPRDSDSYQAEGRRIANLQDPVDLQDAATKGWASSYIAGLVGAIQGPINNAANIFIAGADGLSHVVQDLATTIGAYIVGYKGRSVGRRLEDRGSAADFGVVADGVTLNDTALATALANTKGGKLMLDDSNYVVVSAFPPNPRGIRVEGTGAIVKPVTGGLKQLNTYTSKFGIGVHKEAMYKAYARLAAGGQLKMLFAGDSTIQGGNGENPSFYLATIVGQIMANKGFNNTVVQNIGVAGTSVSDLNAIPSIDATGANSTDILFIKYGINDPKNRSTYYATYRAKLAAIRAATNGSVNALSIVIIGPTSTYDIPNSRDAKWYEQLREIHVSLAEEFQCAFYDAYALLQDTSSASTFWQDNPFGDNRGVHMLDVGQTWLWGNLFDFLFGRGEISQFAKNNIQNGGAASGSVSVGTPITSFPMVMSVYRCTDGPVNGQMMTIRHVDGGGYQTLFGFGTSPKQIYRTWNVAGSAWTGWSGTTTLATLLNGWVAFGGTRATPGFYRDGNRGYACGTIKSGTVTAGTVLFIVPAELRPTADYVCLNRGAGGGVGIGINGAGNVFLQSAGDATETCLDGLSWPIG